MKSYTNTVETSIPWLPRIPKHWELKRNKNIFSEAKETVGGNSSQYKLLSLTTKGIIIRDVSSGKGKFPKDFNAYKIVNEGDMVFCLFDIDETPRTVGLSSYHGMITGAYTIFHVRDINPSYVYYYYVSLDDIKALRPLYSGLRKTIKTGTFLGSKLPVPPRKEQDQIVRFLDWKVSSINKLINVRKKQIEELEELKRSKTGSLIMGQLSETEMKDTAVSWVNTLPTHWQEKTVVQIAEEQLIKNTGMVEDNLLSLSYGKIINKDINTTNGLLPSSFEGYQIVHDGNIVLRLTDLQNDHKSLRTGLATQTGIITSAYTCLKVREGIVPEYLQLQLHVADLCKVFYGMGGGVRQSIGFKEIRKMIIAIPPIEEQHEILDAVHGVEEPINAVIQKKREIILSLEDLKKRLISDVVVGRFDVRDIDIPKYEHIDEEADEDIEDDDINKETEAQED